MQEKQLPSAEASLKFMAWDVKRIANATEQLVKLIADRQSSAPQPKQRYHHDTEAPF